MSSLGAIGLASGVVGLAVGATATFAAPPRQGNLGGPGSDRTDVSAGLVGLGIIGGGGGGFVLGINDFERTSTAALGFGAGLIGGVIVGNVAAGIMDARRGAAAAT